MIKNNSADLSCNQTIREAIQKIALHGVADPATGVIRNSGKTTGFVAKIHTDGELAGTIDIQEYYNLSADNNKGVQIGYHEGVYLSAIQNNSKGMVVVPKLYSEVTIVMDPESKTEYVSMFSHVDIIQLDSHDIVTIGVTEREEFKPDDEDAPDVDELEETGLYARSIYTKDAVVTDIQGEADEDHSVHTLDNKKFQVVIGEDKSSLLIDQEKITLKHEDAESVLGKDSHTTKFGNSSVVVEDGTVYIGSKSGVDDAVLGSELATILIDMLDYMSQIKTPTQLGPQPPVNMAQFIALKAKINAFKSSHSGFLTQKVKVQK